MSRFDAVPYFILPNALDDALARADKLVEGASDDLEQAVRGDVIRLVAEVRRLRRLLDITETPGARAEREAFEKDAAKDAWTAEAGTVDANGLYTAPERTTKDT